jgi:hypothetical protein
MERRWLRRLVCGVWSVGMTCDLTQFHPISISSVVRAVLVVVERRRSREE